MTFDLNDNEENNKFPEAEPHGVCAMLLVESLIHKLIELKVITTSDAIEVVDVASDVQREMAEDDQRSAAGRRKCLDLLDSISTSLSHDLLRS